MNVHFECKMAKTFTVATARQQFANLIASAERGGVVEITRRGKPVAVVISAAQYAGVSSFGSRAVIPTFAFGCAEDPWQLNCPSDTR